MPPIPERSPKVAGPGRSARPQPSPKPSPTRPAPQPLSLDPDPEPVRELHIPRPLWWGGVLAFGVFLIVSFEFGSSFGERRARARAEAQTLASAQPPKQTTQPETKTSLKTSPPGLPVSADVEPTPKPKPPEKSVTPVVKEEPKKLPTEEPKKEEPKKTVEVTPPADPVPDLRFAKDILPIFQARCNSCHGTLSKKGDLDLRTLTSTIRGGNSGPGVKPGQAGNSPVWQEIKNGQMPPKNKPQLTDDEKKLILAWIAGGAK